MNRDAGEWVEGLAAEPSEALRRQHCEGDARTLAEVFPVLQARLLQLAYANTEQAGRLAQCGEWMAEIIGDARTRGIAERGKGHIAYIRGEYAVAAAFYRRAVQLLEGAQAEVEVGRTMSSALQTLIYLGAYDEALEWADRAQCIFTKSGDALRLARLASNRGNIWYRQDRYELALDNYVEALHGLQKYGQPSDIAAALSNLAVCRISLGRFREALETYEEARRHCEQHNLPLLTAAADYNIAYLHYLQGRYSRALQLYDQTKAHCRTAGDPYHAALCDLDESELLLELNLFDEALQAALSSSEAFRTLRMPYEQGKALAFAGLAAAKLRNQKRASALLEQASRLFQAAGNSFWISTLHLHRALVLEQEGKITQALSACKRAEAGYQRTGSSYRAVFCSLYQVRLLLRRGDWWQARRYLPEVGEDAALPLRYEVNLLKGEIAESGGQRAAAVIHYGAARSQLEELRRETGTLAQRLAMVQDRCEVYHRLALLELGNVKRCDEEVFHLFEQFRSRTLFESIFTGPEQSVASDARMEQLESELHACYRRLEGMQTSQERERDPDLTPIRRRVRECEDELKAVLAAGRPRFLSDPLDARNAITAEAMRDALPAETTLIEFAVLRNEIYACILDARRIQICCLGDAAEARANLHLLQFQLARRAAGSGEQTREDTAVSHHLNALHAQLLAPMRKWIENPRLLMVPHRFLHAIPFHALQQGSRYVLDDFEVQYAPSGSVYAACSARKREPLRPMIVGFSDIKAPAIGREVDRVAEILPGASRFSGEHATREAFRRNAPDCGTLHVAAHAVFRPDNVMFSSLLLADGAMPLWELRQMPLKAQLAVLSGCGTGLNQVTGGDELIGFVRAFLSAGVNQVVASLWDVHDGATALLMDAFYKRWKETGETAMALGEAMQTLRKHFPHPAFWAAFAVWGGKNS
ncbi:MAG: CHAT domain-containing protein [Bryobacterales bacterium]|nr:CHAT domain-containing protein [Bryobacterales bacterium]